jgi:hypothetical protein
MERSRLAYGIFLEGPYLSVRQDSGYDTAEDRSRPAVVMTVIVRNQVAVSLDRRDLVGVDVSALDLAEYDIANLVVFLASVRASRGIRENGKHGVSETLHAGVFALFKSGL